MKNEGVENSSQYDKLNNDLNAIDTFIGNFIEKYDIPFQKVIEMLREKGEQVKPTLVPSYILRDRKLGILECITKYLKEEFKFSYHQIAGLLKRDDRVVWVTYNNAAKKKKEKFAVKEPNVWLPISIFTDKNFGPLESITVYLYDQSKLSFNEIAKLLDRDNRTIWAVYHKQRGDKK